MLVRYGPLQSWQKIFNLVITHLGETRVLEMELPHFSWPKHEWFIVDYCSNFTMNIWFNGFQNFVMVDMCIEYSTSDRKEWILAENNWE